MLESLLNQVAGLQDYYKTYLLHALSRFYLSLGKTLKKFIHFFLNYVLLKNVNVKFTEVYLEPSRTSTIELFLTLVKPYFKNILNSIELPLGSTFYTTHPFVKKLTAVKTSGEKVFC